MENNKKEIFKCYSKRMHKIFTKNDFFAYHTNFNKEGRQYWLYPKGELFDLHYAKYQYELNMK